MIRSYRPMRKVGPKAFAPPTRALPPGPCTWCGERFLARYYTDRWPEWQAVMRDRLGEEPYEELRRLALADPLEKPDYRLIADALR